MSAKALESFNGEVPEDEKDRMKMTALARQLQEEENKTNEKMRERILQLAKEADKYGYFD